MAAVCLLAGLALAVAEIRGVTTLHRLFSRDPQNAVVAVNPKAPDPTTPPDSLKSTAAKTPPAVVVIPALRRFEGHADAIWTIAFSKDSCFALTGSGDRPDKKRGNDTTVRLWNVERGEQVHCFPVHAPPGRGIEQLLAVAFAPDGREVLAVSKFALLRWDVATKEPRAGFPCPTERLAKGGAISADGRRALTSIHGPMVTLWDLDHGKELRRWQAHDEAVLAMAFAPSGQQIAVAGSGYLNEYGVLLPGKDHSVRLWDISAAEPKELHRWDGHRGYVWGLAFSPSGNQVVSGGVYAGLFQWNTRDAVPRRQFARPGTITAVAYCSDGRHFVTGATAGEVRLWAVETGLECCRFEGLKGAVRSVASSPDGRWVLAGDHHGDLRLWPVPALQSP
jgi:WD40 repeat protein